MQQRSSSQAKHDTEVAARDDETIHADAQPGVQDIEAITLTWGRSALIAAYILMWMIYFVEGMLSQSLIALSPYVVSDFVLQPLLPTVGILSAIISGVSNLTIAKILDVWGRPQGFILCVVIGTIGLIMLSATNSIELFAAAQVFYTVGNNGLQYSLGVFIADTSSLKNRGLMQAFATSPYMITCWLAGPIASGFLAGPGWHWAFGMFTILVPAFTVPLFALFMYEAHRARKQQIRPPRPSRTFLQAVCYYLVQFDAIGLLLITAGVALFPLPFNVYTLQSDGWSSPLIICLLVFGVVLIAGFVIWEALFAPVTFLPWTLLKDRTVFGACMLSFAAFFSNACWNSYWNSFLQVVADLSVTNASYVQQIGTVGSVLASLGVGGYIAYTGRFKFAVLFFGLPLSLLGTGLLIYFRQPDQYVGFIIMSQIFIAAGGGVVVVTDEIAALAAVDHQHIAVVIAALGVFGGIGAAIGFTVAASIWQSVLPNRLQAYLPADAIDNFALIYGDIQTQLLYDVGTPTRIAIQQAYGDAQKYLLITATAIYAVGVAGVLLWRNIDVKQVSQVLGRVV